MDEAKVTRQMEMKGNNLLSGSVQKWLIKDLYIYIYILYLYIYDLYMCVTFTVLAQRCSSWLAPIPSNSSIYFKVKGLEPLQLSATIFHFLGVSFTSPLISLIFSGLQILEKMEGNKQRLTATCSVCVCLCYIAMLCLGLSYLLEEWWIFQR